MSTPTPDRLDYEQYPNMIVHVKVSKLVKFDRLTPNYVATRSKKGLKWYQIN